MCTVHLAARDVPDNWGDRPTVEMLADRPALHVRPITIGAHVRDAVARDAMARTPRMCECGRPERECFPPADGLARRDAYMAHCAGNTQPFTDIITPYAKDTRTPRDLGMTPSPTRAMRDTWRKS